MTNYGLAIIVIVISYCTIYITTFNGNSSENMHMMREKTNVVKPELDAIREKIKKADTQEERNAANQLLMKKYKSYGINPFKT